MDLTVFVFLLISLFQFQPVAYCECTTLPYKNDEDPQLTVLKNALTNSDFVFYGEVMQINDHKMDEWETAHLGHDPQKPKEKITHGAFPLFRVVSIYKNELNAKSLDSLQIYQQWSDCDMIFEASGRYLVFANLSNDNRLYTSICVPNKRIKADDDLKEISLLIGF
jgi:hypothetical protein